MCGITKTTIYLPDDMKAALERAAARSRRSEADIIREAIALTLSQLDPPTPTIPIFVSDDPTFAQRVDEHLGGFGER